MKKTLLIIAMLAATAANADTIGYAPNSAGGRINLTDNTNARCAKGYMVAYSTHQDRNQDILRGCWKVIDHNAHIIWDTGAERMFDLDLFTITDYGNKTYGGNGNGKNL